MMSGRIIGSRAGCVKRMCVCFILSLLLIVFASFFYKVFGISALLPTFFCGFFRFFEVFVGLSGMNFVCCCGFLCFWRNG